MGLFKKKPETKIDDKNEPKLEELRKQLELAEKKAAEQKQKEKESQEFNQTEDFNDFISEDKIDDTDITQEIEKYVESNGTEQTISFLNTIITRLNVQLVLETLQEDNENENPEEQPEFEE